MRTPLFILVMVFVSPVLASGSTIHVPGDYRSIQEAIEAAEVSSTIIVAPGTYNEAIDFLGKKITVISDSGPEVTLIDAVDNPASSVVKFMQSETRESILEGFTLVNGTGTLMHYGPDWDYYYGGGIYCSDSSPTIRNNIIRDNSAQNHGGGICVRGNASPLFTQNSIIDNYCEREGGGVYCDTGASPEFEENTISANKADREGGGIYCTGCSIVFRDGTISTNHAFHFGGVYLFECTSILIDNNEVKNNFATNGGYGLRCQYCDGAISNNTVSWHSDGGILCVACSMHIYKNTVSHNSKGGGIYCGYNPETLIEDNIVIHNSGGDGCAGGVRCAEGDTVIHNIISDNSSSYKGGGIRANRAVIKDNLIVDNTSVHGGGVFYVGKSESAETVEYNIIRGNTADYGGGIYCSKQGNVLHNTIENNNATQEGGGVYIENVYQGTLYRNLISENTAETYGGGIFIRNAGTILSENQICDNSALLSGGGMCIYATSQLVVEHNILTHNSAENHGGGIHAEGDLETLYDGNMITVHLAEEGGGISLKGCLFADFSNNIVAKNEASIGAGFYIEDSLCSMTNNTISANNANLGGGGASCFGSNLHISNTIFWNNVAPTGSQVFLGYEGDAVILNIDHSDVQGGLNGGVWVGSGSSCFWNLGMIDVDPHFLDPVSADYHILYTSPCREAGSNEAVTLENDFEGDPRIAGGTVDMGADEFHRHLFCTGDFTPQGQVKANILGEANVAPNYLVVSGGLLSEPLNLSIGIFYLDMPWFLIDLMSTIPPSGLLQLPGELPRLPAAPYDLHMQALVGGKRTNLFTMEVR